MFHQPLEQKLHQAQKSEQVIIQRQVKYIAIGTAVVFEVPYLSLYFSKNVILRHETFIADFQIYCYEHWQILLQILCLKMSGSNHIPALQHRIAYLIMLVTALITNCFCCFALRNSPVAWLNLEFASLQGSATSQLINFSNKGSV